jgi:hypothetical protein
MKACLMAILIGAAALGVSAVALADPPSTVVPVPAPPVVIQRDGPYRLLVAAKADARHRRAHGFQADIAKEAGLWWVVYHH